MSPSITLAYIKQGMQMSRDDPLIYPSACILAFQYNYRV